MLANTGDRPELRFRFSLHYASLFPKEERMDAFLPQGIFIVTLRTLQRYALLSDEASFLTGPTIVFDDGSSLMNRLGSVAKSPHCGA